MYFITSRDFNYKSITLTLATMQIYIYIYFFLFNIPGPPLTKFSTLNKNKTNKKGFDVNKRKKEKL